MMTKITNIQINESSDNAQEYLTFSRKLTYERKEMFKMTSEVLSMGCQNPHLNSVNIKLSPFS